MKESPSQKRQIRNLLFVLMFGIAAALMLSLFLVINYGPSGRYLVKNVLLSPDLVSTLAYTDNNRKTGGSSRYVFDGIEFTYHTPAENKLQTLYIDPHTYEKFYRMISSDKSLAEVPPQFNQSKTAALLIKARTESHAEWQDETKIFQEVRFFPDQDYYQIQLRDHAMADPWVYYYHPQIYQKALNIFIPSSGTNL